ncbi:MAG: chromate transporter [Burkholderiales bacterium]|nr:chromate transporter [Burkholderiales bacterium]|tara:strand:+ start:3679 stop:4203 length:525 start_codon:yes stop_codon:yes gene_type:complete
MSLVVWMTLLANFAFLSFLAIGGVMAVAPDMHRLVVDGLSLVSNQEFLAAVTLGKLSPGPNALFVAVLGYQISGFSGALLIMFAMIVPSAIFAFYVSRWRHRNSHRLSVQSFAIGSSPVVVGLLFSTALILMKGFSGISTLICLMLVALIVWKTRLHLLLLMAIGALLGVAGFV